MNPFSELETKNSELKILLIMSSPEELRPFLHTVRHYRASFHGRKAWSFQGHDFTGLALMAGMGGTAPADLTVRAIPAVAPDIVIVAGFGGALTAQPPPGGLLIASECWHWGSTGWPRSGGFLSPGAVPGPGVSPSGPRPDGVYRSTDNHSQRDTQSLFAGPDTRLAATRNGPGNGRSCRRRPIFSLALPGGPGYYGRRW